MSDFVDNDNKKSKFGIICSGVVHTLILGLLIFGFPKISLEKPEQEIPVVLVDDNVKEESPEVAVTSPSAETEKQDKARPSSAFEATTPDRSSLSEEKQNLPATETASESPRETQAEIAMGTREPLELSQGALEAVANPADEQRDSNIAPAESSPSLTDAKQIYSKETLSNPRVKEAFGKLLMNDRMVQICSIEALEQLRRQKAGTFPDILAPTGSVTRYTSFQVNHGAFRSQGKWYNVNFHCHVNADATAVTQFSYHIGSAILERDWNARELPRD